MRIVSETSAAELAKRAAEHGVSQALKQMAANLLRVIRGAGRPYQVGFDLAECVQAFTAYEAAFGHFPSDVSIARALDPGKSEEEGDWDWPPDGDEETAYRWSRQRSRRDMRLAALQITASMLIGQKLQLARGEDDLDRGIARHEQAKQDIDAYRASVQAGKSKRPRGALPKRPIVL